MAAAHAGAAMMEQRPGQLPGHPEPGLIEARYVRGGDRPADLLRAGLARLAIRAVMPVTAPGETGTRTARPSPGRCGHGTGTARATGRRRSRRGAACQPAAD